MKFMGPPGDYYEHEGTGDQRVMVVTEKSGKKWRECLGPELDPAKLDPQRLVRFGFKDTDRPHPAGEYADMRFAGRHPFLHGLCMLGLPVYLEEREETGK